ncbi:5-carboxymethyl-2-hydroxymuconate Delta-isomerase [Comamonas composti]|uniref:5-carboxymethyl-2-hydroxymuconate Delta-isomerase n=1 Tax=Comamonas composti TaxID=408558 RepID=UPI000426E67C|nr:5-carboxymethyl-2-hydroxymuconate Delta-isomerase [Comamonas composti]
MPHLYVEYTDNLAGLPGRELLTALNAVVCAHPSIQDEADVKARLLRISDFEIGTSPANRGFVHVQLRLLAGRSDAAKKELSDAMAEVLHRLTPQPAGIMVQLSVEIADMDKPCYYKGRL